MQALLSCNQLTIILVGKIIIEHVQIISNQGRHYGTMSICDCDTPLSGCDNIAKPLSCFSATELQRRPGHVGEMSVGACLRLRLSKAGVPFPSRTRIAFLPAIITAERRWSPAFDAVRLHDARISSDEEEPTPWSDGRILGNP